ncbi:MAG: cation:proton antiporter [Xenococcaceae cyanobacterium]
METPELPNIFVIGLFLMFGGSAYALGRYLHLPRVTLLVVSGVVVGPSVLDIIPHEIVDLFPTISYIALAMVAFRLGEAFMDFDLKERGPTVFFISLGKTIAAASLVFAAVLLIQRNIVLGLLLAGLAPASAPAATLDVISETKAKGPLTNTIIRVLALDNILAIALFSLMLVVADTLIGQGQPSQEILSGLWEIGGAFLLGFVIGWPMARLAGGLKAGKPSLLEITGFVLLCAGLAYQLQISYLLACIVLGATVAKNRAQPKKNIFLTVEDVSEPFLVIFFLLAGCELELSAVTTLGFVGIAYVITRCLGFVIGGRLASWLVNAEPVVQEHIGWCLFPQAGVALGLAVISLEHFPDLGKLVVSVIVSTTVIFELFGPTVTRWRLFKAKEATEATGLVQSENLPFVQESK